MQNLGTSELKVTLNAKAGASSSTGGSAGYEKKTSWCESCSASGHALPIMDDDSGKPRGVFWNLGSNPKEVSVPSEITVAMLLSRSSDEPYQAEFRIEVTAGTLYNLAHGMKSVFGLKPGTTRPYIVRPSKTPIKRGRGENLFHRAKVEPTNLGEWNDEEKLTTLTFVGG